MKSLQDTLMYITTNNSEKNKKILCKEYGTLHYKDQYDNSLYHLIITCHTGSSMKSYAIETLFKNDIDLNHKNKDGDTFIHYALKNNVDILMLPITVIIQYYIMQYYLLKNKKIY